MNIKVSIKHFLGRLRCMKSGVSHRGGYTLEKMSILRMVKRLNWDTMFL